jgi:cation transport ATPase
MENNKKYKFHVHGMHCNSCVLLTESEIGDLPNVLKVKSNLSDNTIEVEGNFGGKTDEQIAEELTKPLKDHGYTVSVEKQVKETKWSDFKIALPIALVFIFGFVFLQKIGVVNFIDIKGVSFSTAFLIGIIASLSSCMAVVGGLVLSMSATFAKEGDRFKPQILFHVGRIVSFGRACSHFFVCRCRTSHQKDDEPVSDPDWFLSCPGDRRPFESFVCDPITFFERSDSLGHSRGFIPSFAR